MERKPAAPDGVELPEIDGIDMAAGLTRVAGNKRLYRRLLEQFAGQQANVAAQVADALQRGDRALGERLAHTLKGVAGNIGMGSVQLSAEKVERAIRQGDASVPALLAELDSCLGPTVQAIRSTFSAVAPAPVAEFAAADAADAVEAVVKALAGTVDTKQLDELQTAIAEFDFERAAGKLSDVVTKYHLTEVQE